MCISLGRRETSAEGEEVGDGEGEEDQHEHRHHLPTPPSKHLQNLRDENTERLDSPCIRLLQNVVVYALAGAANNRAKGEPHDDLA